MDDEDTCSAETAHVGLMIGAQRMKPMLKMLAPPSGHPVPAGAGWRQRLRRQLLDPEWLQAGELTRLIGTTASFHANDANVLRIKLARWMPRPLLQAKPKIQPKPLLL
jgi:hypothetical protein